MDNISINQTTKIQSRKATNLPEDQVMAEMGAFLEIMNTFVQQQDDTQLQVDTNIQADTNMKIIENNINIDLLPNLEENNIELLQDRKSVV